MPLPKDKLRISFRYCVSEIDSKTRFILANIELAVAVYSAGIAYDTSPVEDKDRTIDLPLDEQFKFSVGYAKRGKANGATL